MWGGDTSWSAPPPEDDLWQFSADGSGGGSWVKQAPASPSSFSKLLRVTWGASTASNDAGFYLGGQLGPGTDSAIPEGGPWSVSGIVSFNITTGVWANSTSAPLGGTGRNVGGALQFIPSFGPNGLLLFMGGRFASSSALLSFVDFDVINMYDPVAKSWYAQDATGEMPSPRVNSCTVGVQGPNKTYEIFLYGGNDEKVAYGDVYVLSVPGFFWSKANHTQSSGRWSHTCAVAGKRQMISVGGLNQSLETNTWYAGVDQITRGIGVFDLTALEWSDKYDANADGYQSPDIVKNWYASGKQSTVQWASDEVRALFNHSTGSQGAKPSSTPAAPTPAAPAPTGSHHTNSGAIAGGVVGGVILLLCIGALIWLLQRQRRRKHSSLDQPPKSTAPVLASKPEMESWERNMLDGVPRSELDAVDRRRLGPYELQHSPSARRS
ncbi:MAG: hypothetical protein M4579_007219 [Chaenotheca gracillima]|nr:MAG: hypothetical protein M4579_007219 [Chaenotheca gracillima]